MRGRVARAALAAGALLLAIELTAGSAAAPGRRASCPGPRLSYAAAPAGVSWLESASYGPWYAAHDGFGFIRVENTAQGRRLWLSPRPPAAASDTYSSLVRSVRSFSDVDFTVAFRTLAQLRRPRPNAWEVAWAIWRYRDNEHFYYFIVKPNGWELGKEDPAYAGKQRFLASSSAHRFPVGAWYRVRVQHIGDDIRVWVDDRLVVSFRDRQRPYRSGAIGLYVEDARAVFGPVTLRRC